MRLKQALLTPSQVARSLAEAFAEMIFCHGHVHADPHPGNILVNPHPLTRSRSLLSWLWPGRPAPARGFDLGGWSHWSATVRFGV